jgi:F-type H+-transporting ATPase subunit b
MELFSALGLDLRIFIAQFINFAILVFVLYRFAYNPILKLLDERKEKIKRGLEDAEAAAKALAEASEEKKHILAAANKEAEAMSARAKEFADKKATDLLTEAQKKAEQMVKDAALRGEELKVQARKESEAEIAKLAILAAEKVLKEKTT